MQALWKMVNRKNKKGFTLIEMLVVLVIIGILIGLAVPALSAVQKEARLTEANANARAVYVAAVAASFNATGVTKLGLSTMEATPPAGATKLTAATDTFVGRLATNLGTDFPGTFRVNVDGSNVIGTEWSEAATNTVVGAHPKQTTNNENTTWAITDP